MVANHPMENSTVRGQPWSGLDGLVWQNLALIGRPIPCGFPGENVTPHEAVDDIVPATCGFVSMGDNGFERAVHGVPFV